MYKYILFLLLIPLTVGAQESKPVIAKETSEDLIEILCRHRYADNSRYVLSCMTTQTRARNIFTEVFKKYWPEVKGDNPMLRLVVRNTDNARVLVGRHVVIDWIKFNVHFKHELEIILFFVGAEKDYPDVKLL